MHRAEILHLHDNKMSDNETQSITQWEKTHATERKACDAEAGWK